MTTWLKKIKYQSLGIFIAFLFFLAALSWINMIEGLFEGETPFNFYTVVIAAGIIAKTLIVLSHLPWINPFPNKPLIYNILWKTMLYEIGVLIVKIGIDLVLPCIKTHSFQQGYSQFLLEFHPHRFFAIQLCYLFLFLIFASAQELALSLGPKRLRKLIFGK